MAIRLGLTSRIISGIVRQPAVSTTLAQMFMSSSTVKPQKLPQLYSFWCSSCSWRIRIAMNLKNILYDINPVSFSKKESTNLYTEEFREINPMQRVPALQIDGHTLCDSVAIMHYLEESRPAYALLPQDPLQRAKVREIVEIICSSIQPLQNVGVLDYVGDAGRLGWAQHWIIRGFQGLENILAASSGKYCVGNEITLADVCLVPQVFNAKRYKVDLTPFPIISRLNDDLLKLPAFKLTHPYKQPDCPPEYSKK